MMLHALDLIVRERILQWCRDILHMDNDRTTKNQLYVGKQIVGSKSQEDNEKELD